MSKNITTDKAAALARAYTTNGWNKKKALMTAGWPERFAKSTAGSHIFDKPVVRVEIDKIVARCDEIADVEVFEIVRGLKEIAFPGEGIKVNNSDRNMALAHLAKYKNMFTDRLLIGITEQERELSEAEAAAADEIAHIANRRSIQRHLDGPSEEAAETFSDNDILNG